MGRVRKRRRQRICREYGHMQHAWRVVGTVKVKMDVDICNDEFFSLFLFFGKSYGYSAFVLFCDAAPLPLRSTPGIRRAQGALQHVNLPPIHSYLVLSCLDATKLPGI